MAKHGRTMSGGDLEAGAERTKALDVALGQIVSYTYGAAN